MSVNISGPFFNAKNDFQVEYKTTVNGKKIFQMVINKCFLIFMTNCKYACFITQQNLRQKSQQRSRQKSQQKLQQGGEFHIVCLDENQEVSENTEYVERITGLFKKKNKGIQSLFLTKKDDYDYMDEEESEKQFEYEKFTNLLRGEYNLFYVDNQPDNCFSPMIDLTEAQTKIADINKKLNCIDYSLSLDYVFNMPENSEAVHYFVPSEYSPDPSAKFLILCIFTQNKCVSSLTLEVSKDRIVFSSKTKEEYEGKKMNKLLRTVLILIAETLMTEGNEPRYVVSDAINAISAYTMIKYFNAIPYIYNEYTNRETPIKIDGKIQMQKIKDIMQSSNGELSTKVLIDSSSTQNADTLFEEVKKEFICDKNPPLGSQSVKNKKRKTKTVSRTIKRYKSK